MRGGQSGANPLEGRTSALALLQFSLPSIVSMLFMGLYTTADTALVSRMAGTLALSALNIVCPAVNLLVGLGTMMAAGGSAVIARKMGEGREDEARQDFQALLLLAAGLGTGAALGGRFFLEELVTALGASPALAGYCMDYLGMLLVFAPACLLQVMFQNLIVTAGRPGLGMALAVGAGAINVVLDVLFMGPLGMGVSGAALGTGLGYMGPVVLGLLFFGKSRGPLRFGGRQAFHLRALAYSFLNGSSELVSQLSAAVTTFLFNRAMMRLLGEDGVAAVTIMIYTQFLLTTACIGFSMGVAPVLSYQMGKGDFKELGRAFRICLAVTAATGLGAAAGAMIFSGPLVGVFAGEGSRVYEIAREGFRVFPVCFLFSGVNIFVTAAFTALSEGAVSAALAFLRTFGLIGLGLLILPGLLGTAGVWVTLPLAEAGAFLAAVLTVRRYGRRRGLKLL